ncbi:MAG: DUF1573 domain-containing protein [Verrucomicrobia bacterium]|nr:DUF1573 domain-containing protein [Verrucomicrobiota bacterium]
MPHVLAWLILITLAGATHAQELAPTIVCDVPVYDFGTVPGTEDITHLFAIRNAGDAELIINRVHATCGCTTATPAANNVPPGGTVEISAKLSLTGRTGDQHKTIYVESNDPKTPQFSLEMKGHVQRDIDYRPQQVMLQISAAAPDARSDVQITFNTPEAYTVTGVDATKADFCTATFVENTAGRSYTINISAITNYANSSVYLSGSIGVLTDMPKQPRIDIPVMLTRIRGVTVAPNQLTLVSRLPTDAPFSQQIVIRSRTPEPMALLEIIVPPGEIESSSHPMNENMYRIELIFRNFSKDLDGKAVTIRVKRQDAEEETYDVPIRVVN